MSASPSRNVATVADFLTDGWTRFDTLLDVRAPGEYADDHLPQAINLPVLFDDERARVGTLYKQVSVFAAKKVGAALVAKNIAHHIENHLLEKPKNWRPLVYCWRGGQRSGAFTHILREIGWDAHRLHGGYKSWRRHVIEHLARLPAQFDFRVISGATGSGKSRLLELLAQHGAQIVHLEKIAAHKGSVLGGLPGQTQPSQKCFESRLLATLAPMDSTRPVFIEAESRKIGQLQLPTPLLDAIRQAPCLRIDASLEARVAYLLHDYDYAIANPDWLSERLKHLHGLQSKETLSRWQSWIAHGEFPPLVMELLALHYDPLYQRSQKSNFATPPTSLTTDDLSPEALNALAERILAHRA